MKALAFGSGLPLARIAIFLGAAAKEATTAAAFDFRGLWEGIDPVDSSVMLRSILALPANGANNYTITGHIECAEICADDIAGNVTQLPNASDVCVMAVLNGYGQVVDGELRANLGQTCFGTTIPQVPDIEVVYRAVPGDVMEEIPSFRPQYPVYYHRISSRPVPAGNGGSRSMVGLALGRILLVAVGGYISVMY